MKQEFSKNSPTDYDTAGETSTLTINPYELWQNPHVFMAIQIAEIEESWGKIGKTWSDLRLGWTGSSAEEAEKFNDRLQDAQNEMFGLAGETEDESKPGILRLLRYRAVQASSNYASADDGVLRLFNEFTDSLTAGGNGEPQAPQSSDVGPIKINYDNHNGVRYQEHHLVGQYIDVYGNEHLLFEGDAMPVKQGSEYYIEEKYYDSSGNEQTNKIYVSAATWKGDGGNVQRVVSPGGEEVPLPLHVD